MRGAIVFLSVAGSSVKVVPIPQLEVVIVANVRDNHHGLAVNTYASLL